MRYREGFIIRKIRPRAYRATMLQGNHATGLHEARSYWLLLAVAFPLSEKAVLATPACPPPLR